MQYGGFCYHCIQPFIIDFNSEKPRSHFNSISKNPLFAQTCNSWTHFAKSPTSNWFCRRKENMRRRVCQFSNYSRLPYMPNFVTGPWGQYKTPDMQGSIRVQCGCTLSALFWLVTVRFAPKMKFTSR